MSADSDDIKIEIQKTLININDVTEKIKREMGLINEIVKAKGHLALAVDEANDTLAKVAKQKSINVTGDLLDPQNPHDDFHPLDPVTMELITQKLMAIMDT